MLHGCAGLNLPLPPMTALFGSADNARLPKMRVAGALLYEGPATSRTFATPRTITKLCVMYRVRSRRSGLAARDRARRIANPFAPRAGVEPRTAQPRNLKRKQVVTRGHAGAAHGHELARGARPEQRAPAAAQRRGIEEAPLRIKVAREGRALRTGHVAGDRIDLLVLAGEAIRGARMDEQNLARRKRSAHLIAAQRRLRIHMRCELARRPRLAFGADRQARRKPCGVTAVEHGHLLMTDPAQQPPGARRVGAVALIISHHLHAPINAPACRSRAPRLNARQRMAAAARADRARKIAIQMRVERVRDVTGGICTLAPVGLREFEAAIEDRALGLAHEGGKLCGFDKRGVHES